MAITLEDLKYFKRTAELLNMTRASEQLGISQPALSHALKKLEGELRTSLFIRLKNGLALSQDGEDFKSRCSQLIKDWENLQSGIANEEYRAKATYKIGVHSSVALFTVDKFLPKVLERFPEITLDFSHGLSRVMTEKVISWEVDFGIVVNPVKHPDIVIKELYQDTVTLFAADGALNKLIIDADLAQTQFVLSKLNSKFEFASYIKSSSLELIAQMASSGLGYAVLPESIAKKYKKLKAIQGAPHYLDRICLVYRKPKQQSQVSRALIEIILKEIG